MKTWALVQVRLSSRRFPRKALADLNGHPLIWHVITQVAKVKGLDRIVLATVPGDAAELREAMAGLPCEVEAPDVPEDDVLARFAAAAADLADDDWIMRITGDCPAWRPEVGERLRQRRNFVLRWPTLGDPLWYSADTNVSGYPDGTDAELFPAWMLRQAADEATWPLDREHVTRFMHRYFLAEVIQADTDEGHLALSVNTPEDLTRVRQYLRAVHHEGSR